MSADTISPKLRRLPPRTVLLFGANALTQFAIQAYLAYGFAAHVWPLPAPLPYAAPIALDVFAINLMGFAYELRNAALRQRIYVWGWLGVVIGAQVAAAEGYAAHEDWSLWGRGASLFPSIFLAASLHALIIAARKRDHALLSDAPARVGVWAVWRTKRGVARALKAERKSAGRKPLVVTVDRRVILEARTAVALAAPPVPERPVLEHTTKAEQATGAAPVRARPARRELPAAPRPRGRRSADRPNDALREIVIKRCLDADPAEDAKAVALELGANPRTAQLWVKVERDQRAMTSRSATGGAPPGA
jgi:hypothetical protein